MRKNRMCLLISAMLIGGGAVAQPAQPPSLTLSNGLSTATGHYVLGNLDSPSGRSLYIVDTKTGAVWSYGCIGWDANDKCNVTGFRTVGFSDGAGGKVFNNAKEAAEAAGFGSLLRR